MDIVDAAHAVKILQSLVEQGEKRLETWKFLKWNDGSKTWQSIEYRSTLLALVEGAKAVLEIWHPTLKLYEESKIKASGPSPNPTDVKTNIALHNIGTGQSDLIWALGIAYAPRMAEAGMDVPS